MRKYAQNYYSCLYKILVDTSGQRTQRHKIIICFRMVFSSHRMVQYLPQHTCTNTLCHVTQQLKMPYQDNMILCKFCYYYNFRQKTCLNRTLDRPYCNNTIHTIIILRTTRRQFFCHVSGHSAKTGLTRWIEKHTFLEFFQHFT